jgi:alpha-galactosidase
MISSNSELYRKHPDRAMQIHGKSHSEGRNQMVIDMANREVQDYLIETLSNLLKEGNVDYVKWDMNRTMTDVYSNGSSADEVGKIFHNYMTGLYRVLKTVKEEFEEAWDAVSADDPEGCPEGKDKEEDPADQHDTTDGIPTSHVNPDNSDKE